MRPFRFGFQFRDPDAAELIAAAKVAEAAGFDVISSWDHVTSGWSPLPPLLAAALATETIRVCPLVINNDFRHPVHLARDILSMDVLTGGRVELGIGAGHSLPEYEAIGLTFDLPSVRKARLRESVDILRPLLSGQEVSYRGVHFELNGVRLLKPHQSSIPILVAAAGREARAHSASNADIIGLTGLGKTHADGQRHDVNWESPRLDEEVAYIQQHSPGFAPELNALVQVVTVGDDREAIAAGLVADIDSLSLEDALTTPFLALGTHDQIAANLIVARQRWGISYFTVRCIEEFAPVIERLRAYDAKEFGS